MFPRAKLQRFNDVISCAPPPGAYDPKFEEKVKGIVIEKTERFIDPKPVATNNATDSNLARSSSLHSLPVFRTPQPPRRVIRKVSSATKSKSESAQKARKKLDSEFETKSECGSVTDLSKLRPEHREISSLNDLYTKTKEELQKSTELCHSLEENIKSEKEVIARLEEEKMELKNELLGVMQQLADSNEQYKAAVEQCNLLDANLAERRAAVEESEQTRTELLLDMEELKKRAEQNAEEIEEVSRRCLELESELAESTALNSRLEKDRAERVKEIGELTERINSLSAEIAAKTEQCNALESGELNLVLELERKVMALDEMNKDMKLRDECIYQLESNLVACRCDLTARIQENEELRLRQNDLENSLKDLTEKVTETKQKCRAMEAEKLSCSEKISELEKVKANLEQCGDSLIRDLEEMHTALVKSNAAMEEVQTRVATEQLEKDKLSEEVVLLSQQITLLEQDLCQKQSIISRLESELSHCQAEIEECKVEAGRQLQEFSAEIERIKDAHDMKMAEVSQELEKNVAACETRVAQAQAEHEHELAKLRNLAYKLEQKVLDEREAHQTLQRDLDEERHAAEVEAHEREKTIMNYRSDLIETRNVLVNVENSLRELDKQHSEALSRHEEELDEARRKIAAAENALWEERQRAEASIAYYTQESEAKILEIQRAAEEAAKEAEEKLRMAEEKHNEKIRQIETAADDLLKRTRGEATMQLEQLKKDYELKVRDAEAEFSSILMKLSEAEEKLRELQSERDNLRTADIERQITLVELQDQVDIMQMELAQSHMNLVSAVKELEQVRAELEVMKRLKRNLELIGNETLATVNAVGKRLLEREVEVERLTRLNEALEEHFNEQKKNITLAESECLRQVEEIRANLLSSLEEFHQRGVDEINRLQNRLSETNDLVEYYKTELMSSNQKLELREAEIAEQAVQINFMQDSMGDLNAKLDQLTKQLCEFALLKETCAKQEEQLRNLTLDLERAKQDAVDAETEIQAREKQIVDLTNQLEDMTEKLHRAEENHATDMDFSKKEIENLISLKADLQSQLESMTTVLECHKMNVSKATERIENLAATIRKNESQIDEMNKEIGNLKEELKKTVGQVEDLKELVSMKEDALIALRTELNKVTECLEESERKSSDLFAELEFEVACRKDCQQQIADMYDDLASRDRVIQESKETVSKLESDICDKAVTIASLETQLRDASERILILKDESEDSLKQITDAEQTIVVLQATKASLEERLSDLEAKTKRQALVIVEQDDELKIVSSLLEKEKDAVQYLKSRIEANHKDLQAAENTKLTLESEISSLKMQIEMLQLQSEELVRDKDAALKKSEDRMTGLEDELSSLKLEVESSKALLEEKESMFGHEISKLKELLDKKQEESKENTETLEKQVRQLEATLDGVTRRKETYKAAVVELQQLAKQNRGNIVNLESELAAAKEERDETLKKLSELEQIAAGAADWEKRCYELEQLIGPFRDQLEAFESERKALEQRKEAAEGEAKDLATKYAQVLGHQNSKQKIHHVIKLKETIQDLKKENERLESQVRSQKRTIDRLKDDISHNNTAKFNLSSGFQGRDDSIQGRLSSVINKSNIELSANRNRMNLSVKNKGKENITENTPASVRPIKVKEEIVTPAHQSPVRSSPVGSPLTPLKERQNNLN